MKRLHRREFLGEVGRGMLVAGVGSVLAQDLGLASAALAAGEAGAERLTFGSMEPLVSLMQETPVDRFLPAVVERIKAGDDLRRLVAAAALANARTFGGQDYDGYHAIMALAPAYAMSRELPESQAALPVLKVLYRNTNHIQQMGGPSHEALHALESVDTSVGQGGAEALVAATRQARSGGGRADLRRSGARTSRRGLQRPPVRRPGRHQRPPRRPRLALLGAARFHRQGTRPHPAPPVGAVLRRRGEQRTQEQRRSLAGSAPQAARTGRTGHACARRPSAG